MAKFAATDAELLKHGLEPTMRWLIARAAIRSDMTYGEIRRRLEAEVGFSPIFTTRIGMVVGELMERIQKIEPRAPLLNVLAVSQGDRLPSRGAGPFMAARFKRPLLRQENAKKRHPAIWEASFEKAATEVYAYRPEEWLDVYRRLFGSEVTLAAVEDELERQKEGDEDDFGTGKGKYGKGGEGPHHKALRLWVEGNPGKLDKLYSKARTDTEFPLDSGDRVDAVYHLEDRTVVLEVKSRISNAEDLWRGVFQCVKYRAVKEAMDARPDAKVDAILVTEKAVPGEISDLLKLHRIRHIQVPLNRT